MGDIEYGERRSSLEGEDWYYNTKTKNKKWKQKNVQQNLPTNHFSKKNKNYNNE